MVKHTGCKCFTCRHSDEPRVLAGYLQGYIDASDWFLNWANKMAIKPGSIADDDLPGIMAQIQCNREESYCLLAEMPNLEEDIERGNLLWEKRNKKRAKKYRL